MVPFIHKNQLRKISVQNNNVGGLTENLAPSTVKLFTANCESLKEISLLELNIETNLISNVNLNNVEKLELDLCSGDINSLLKACSNIKHLVVNGNLEIDEDDDLILASIKILKMCSGRDNSDVSHLLQKCPFVEQLSIINTEIKIENEDFSLSWLTSFSLKNVGMTTKTKDIFIEKLPEELNLDDCMDDCYVYDSDDSDLEEYEEESEDDEEEIEYDEGESEEDEEESEDDNFEDLSESKTMIQIVQVKSFSEENENKTQNEDNQEERGIFVGKNIICEDEFCIELEVDQDKDNIEELEVEKNSKMEGECKSEVENKMEVEDNCEVENNSEVDDKMEVNSEDKNDSEDDELSKMK